MVFGRNERILILAKTYPSPSAQFVETSSVAGITEHGAMRRLPHTTTRRIRVAWGIEDELRNSHSPRSVRASTWRSASRRCADQ
jgi:hypothetical protein